MLQNYIITPSKQTFIQDNSLMSINDYTYQIPINSLLEKYKDNIKEYEVQDDERIEVISYNIYGTADYWDLIMILNDMKQQTELPVNSDKLEVLQQSLYNEWFRLFGKTKTRDQLQAKEKELYELMFNRNEKYRKINYINPSYVNAFNSDLTQIKLQAKKDVENETAQNVENEFKKA